MTEVQTKILSRVRKMLNLANDAGATDGERDNALRMAHATIAKYNLDLSQLEEGASSNKDQNNGEPRERLQDTYLGTTWARTVSQAASTLFFCTYFYERISRNTDNVKHSFVGRHSNAVTAHLMAKYLVDSIHREATRYKNSQGGNYRLYRSFAIAAAHKVWTRCQALREGEEAATPSARATAGTSLVLAGIYEHEKIANDRHIESLGVRTVVKATRTASSLHADAFQQGSAFGSKVSLNRQIN